ncbi:hypothetical protein SSS_08366 [Sarcoptes scabiei]|uniref:Uncharacterized protein n=1 Tax=Sarcoptes scabiei TaxID=52283 RepID=A0A834R7E0_SARSC|nr:hypothetical protein SSS_08366 [Sarcoptes scabiei]
MSSINHRFGTMLFVLFISFLMFDKIDGLKKVPECDIEKPIRNCLKVGFLFEPNGRKVEKFPTTMEGLNKVCSDLKRAEDCAVNFIEQCSDSDHEQKVLESILAGNQRVMKRLCRMDKRKKELLDNVQCANAVVDDTYNCIGDYRRMVYVANKMDDKNKILRALCCKIREVGPCVGKAMKAKGPEVCPAASIEYFKKMRKNLKEEITSIICADFDKDSCKNVEVPAITDAEYKGKSLYGPMRQLYQKVLV